MIHAIFAIALGGALGALFRFGIVAMVQMTFASPYPVGTCLVNGIGSFFAGVLMVFFMDRLANSDLWRLFLVVGFLGAFTTYSSYAWETLQLYQNKLPLAALCNIVFNNLMALALVLAGMHMGRWLERGI